MTKISIKRFLALVIAFTVIIQSANVLPISVKAAGVENFICDVYTDKAMYNPGEQVNVTVELKNASYTDMSGRIEVLAKHLNNDAGAAQSVSYSVKAGKNGEASLSWRAPNTDYQGYLLEVYAYDNNGELIDTEAVGVNVSSSWVKFPLYGYLHEFGDNVDTEGKIAQMNKYHINGIEYYDWHYRHHEPLPSWSTAEDPGTWQDWAGRTTYGQTIKDYISEAKAHNMVSMAYDMIYAGTDDFFKDNEVTNSWKIRFKDGDNAGEEFMFTMGDSPSGNGHLFFVNPLHTDWQIHLFAQLNRMINVMGFDGYHGDTVGDWGDMTDYYGYPLGWDSNGNGIYSVAGTYKSFLNSCKANLPEGAYLTFNPVGAVGIKDVNSSNVDVLYTEFWPWDHSRHGNEYETYAAISKEIEDSMNDSKATSFDGKGKSLGVKAYINYRANGGYINNPTALLMEAVCFASGGYRVELGNGTHMLTDEYYVNDRLPMRESLKTDVRNMYDFAVAYENLLRDGQYTTANKVTVDGYASSTDASANTIWTYTRTDGTNQMLHLINLLGTDNKWRDVDRTKNTPDTAKNFKVKYYYSGNINSVYLASPDIDDCRTRSLAFTKGSDSNGKYVEFTVESLEYWDMIYMSEDSAREIAPANPDMAESIRIEAEDFRDYSESGTVSDDNLYISGLNNNTVSYIIPEDFDMAEYEMAVRYVSAVNGTLNISCGTKDTSVDWKANSPSWGWDGCTDLYCEKASLKAGDVISMHASGAAPYIQIDYITLTKCGAYKFDGESFRLEAESGILSAANGNPVVGESEKASNGKFVHDIGLTQGSVSMKVPENIEKGLYTLNLVYSSSTNGTVSVTVDSKEYVFDYTLTNPNWNFINDYTSIYEVPLRGGETITVHDAHEGCYIWLDCVAAVFTGKFTNECDVTFINGSDELEVQTVEKGKKVTLPEAPSDLDKLFIGWFTEDIGTVNTVDEVILAKAFNLDTAISDDMNLYAGWLSIGTVEKDSNDKLWSPDNNSGFYMLGAQYRPKNEAKNVTAGVRFVARISNSLISSVEAINEANKNLKPENSSDKGIGYGMVLTRAKIIGEGQMIEKDINAANVSAGMMVCPAVKPYSICNGYITYTAVVTGIETRSFNTDIAARMYITYVDANGTEQTFYYTETESSSRIGGGYYTSYNKVYNASNGL